MKNRIPIILLVLGIIFITGPSFPQSTGLRSPHEMGMKRWKGGSPCWRVQDLDLSLEQRKGLHLIQQSYLQETQLFQKEIFTKLLELRELLINPTTKTESLRGKYNEINELRSKHEEKAIEYLIKLRNLLTPDQLLLWCPEREFPSFLQTMHGFGPMRHIPFRKASPPNE